jgi:hypothetical protein
MCLAARGELPEERAQPRFGVGRAALQSRCLRSEIAQAIVRAGIDLEHAGVALEKLDGGQKALALQSVRVEPARRQVRCRNERDPAAE